MMDRHHRKHNIDYDPAAPWDLLSSYFPKVFLKISPGFVRVLDGPPKSQDLRILNRPWLL